MIRMVISKHLQDNSQTSGYLRRPPTQKETLPLNIEKPPQYHILSETKLTSFKKKNIKTWENKKKRSLSFSPQLYTIILEVKE